MKPGEIENCLQRTGGCIKTREAATSNLFILLSLEKLQFLNIKTLQTGGAEINSTCLL